MVSREKRHAWTALIVALSLLAVGPPQHRARAAVPTATEGLIAFVRDGGPPESGIYTITPSGSGLLRLTDGEDYRPRWSPDGSKIVFQRFEAGSAQSYIFVMNADGTNLQRLSTRRGFQPAWSPDGARIVFGSGSRHRAEIFVMNADGSNLTRLTNNTFEDLLPAWSPDGETIAFASKRHRTWDIYLMDSDGTRQRRLTRSSARRLEPRLVAGRDATGLSEQSASQLGRSLRDPVRRLPAGALDDRSHGRLDTGLVA